MRKTFTDFLYEVSREKAEHPEWRIGQTYFNVLRDMHLGLAEEIRSGTYDPFYRDETLPEFLIFVAENWS